LATALPSNREFNKPKTIISTMATTPPDLNLENERSRLDSFRLVSNLSFFLVFDFLVEGAEVFRVSNFFACSVDGGAERFVVRGSVNEKP